MTERNWFDFFPALSQPEEGELIFLPAWWVQAWQGESAQTDECSFLGPSLSLSELSLLPLILKEFQKGSQDWKGGAEDLARQSALDLKICSKFLKVAGVLRIIDPFSGEIRSLFREAWELFHGKSVLRLQLDSLVDVLGYRPIWERHPSPPQKAPLGVPLPLWLDTTWGEKDLLCALLKSVHEQQDQLILELPMTKRPKETWQRYLTRAHRFFLKARDHGLGKSHVLKKNGWILNYGDTPSVLWEKQTYSFLENQKKYLTFCHHLFLQKSFENLEKFWGQLNLGLPLTAPPKAFFSWKEQNLKNPGGALGAYGSDFISSGVLFWIYAAQVNSSNSPSGKHIKSSSWGSFVQNPTLNSFENFIERSKNESYDFWKFYREHIHKSFLEINLSSTVAKIPSPSGSLSQREQEKEDILTMRQKEKSAYDTLSAQYLASLEKSTRDTLFAIKDRLGEEVFHQHLAVRLARYRKVQKENKT